MKCSVPGSSVHGDSPGKNTRAGCHAFILGIFPVQGWNPHLLNWQAGVFATRATYRKRWARTKTQTGCSVSKSCQTLCHSMQHATLPCPWSSPRVCSNSCPLSWWCHPTISSSVISVSSCLQSFPASGSFPVSQLFPSGGQSTGASASALVLPKNIQLLSFRIDWLDLLAVQGTLKTLLHHHSLKISVLQCSAFFMVQLSYPYMTIGKIIALTRWSFVSKVMSLLFNMLSRFVTAFLPRSKCLLISWLQSPSAVILESPENKVCHCFHFFPIYLPSPDGTRCHDLHFLNVEF